MYLRIYFTLAMLALAGAQFTNPGLLTSSTTRLNIVFDVTSTATTVKTSTTTATSADHSSFKPAVLVDLASTFNPVASVDPNNRVSDNAGSSSNDASTGLMPSYQPQVDLISDKSGPPYQSQPASEQLQSQTPDVNNGATSTNADVKVVTQLPLPVRSVPVEASDSASSLPPTPQVVEQMTSRQEPLSIASAIQTLSSALVNTNTVVENKQSSSANIAQTTLSITNKQTTLLGSLASKQLQSSPATLKVATDLSTLPSASVQPATQPSTGPSRSVFGSTVWISAGPSTPTPEQLTHIQIIFGNNYTATVAEGTNMTAYCNALIPSIAQVAGVTQDRIANVTMVSQPETGFMVSRFTVLPYPANQSYCWWNSACGATVQRAVSTLRSLAMAIPGLQLIDNNGTVLSVSSKSNNIVFQSWTDNGFCPLNQCDSSTEVCDCSLSGTLYCRTTVYRSRPQLLYLLLLLLLIPIIVIIFLIVLWCKPSLRKQITRKSEEKKPERRMIRADMLSYHEYTTRGRKPVQPKVETIASRSTLSVNTLNTLHRSLGENISIAFNGSTFIDSAGTDNSDATSSDSILPSNQ